MNSQVQTKNPTVHGKSKENMAKGLDDSRVLHKASSR